MKTSFLRLIYAIEVHTLLFAGDYSDSFGYVAYKYQINIVKI